MCLCLNALSVVLSVHVSPEYRNHQMKPLLDLFSLSEACLLAGTLHCVTHGSSTCTCDTMCWGKYETRMCCGYGLSDVMDYLITNDILHDSRAVVEVGTQQGASVRICLYLVVCSM